MTAGVCSEKVTVDLILSDGPIVCENCIARNVHINPLSQFQISGEILGPRGADPLTWVHLHEPPEDPHSRFSRGSPKYAHCLQT